MADYQYEGMLEDLMVSIKERVAKNILIKTVKEYTEESQPLDRKIVSDITFVDGSTIKITLKWDLP